MSALLQHSTTPPALAAVPDSYIVSLVMVRHITGGQNVQNKLYLVRAVSKEEAHGKGLALGGADFPKHRVHSICSVAVADLPEFERAIG